MSDLKYTKDHEWLSVTGDVGTFGITEYAQEQLGDVVFIELPEVGRKLKQGEDCAVVESVKAASEVYAPVEGEVVESNQALVDNPALVNEDALGKGWFVRLKLTDPGQLDGMMDEAAYKKLLEELA